MRGSPLDTDELLARVDLLDLIGSDTSLRKVAGTRGGEYAGPCPSCGGDDRFRVWPNQPRPGFWCRGCGWSGDAISYVRRRDGLGFLDACVALGHGSWAASTGVPKSVRAMSVVPESPRPRPTDAWLSAAARLIEQAVEALWGSGGARARDWLGKRGLSEVTIRRRRLGFIPGDRWADGQSWGREGRLFLPHGITIPWFVGNEPWNVKVRRPQGTPKYHAVSGGLSILYGAQPMADRRVVVLTEGEFDAMLLEQEAGDLVAAATLGSCSVGVASRGLDGRAIRQLLPFETILLAYDADDEGQSAAQKLAQLSQRMRLVSVPGGKDLTEFWQRGGAVRNWIQFELRRLGEWQRGVVGRSGRPADTDGLLGERVEFVDEVLEREAV